MTGVLLFAGGVVLGLLPYLYAKAEQRAYRGRHVAEVQVDEVGIEIFSGPFEPFIRTPEQAQAIAVDQLGRVSEHRPGVVNTVMVDGQWKVPD